MRNTKNLIEASKFAKFLWGDIFYNNETRKFQKQKNQQTERSFVHFILEPFYKIISVTISKDKEELVRILKSELGGVQLKKSDFEMDVKPMLKLVMKSTFGQSSASLVDMMVGQFVNAKDATPSYVENHFSKNEDSLSLATEISKCDTKGPLCIHIVK